MFCIIVSTLCTSCTSACVVKRNKYARTSIITRCALRPWVYNVRNLFQPSLVCKEIAVTSQLSFYQLFLKFLTLLIGFWQPLYTTTKSTIFISRMWNNVNHQVSTLSSSVLVLLCVYKCVCTCLFSFLKHALPALNKQTNNTVTNFYFTIQNNC